MQIDFLAIEVDDTKVRINVDTSFLGMQFADLMTSTHVANVCIYERGDERGVDIDFKKKDVSELFNALEKLLVNRKLSYRTKDVVVQLLEYLERGDISMKQNMHTNSTDLTINGYQEAAMRTAQPDMHLQINRKKALLLNGLMGLNGEAGEALDIMKKHLCQGHDLDLDHIAKELGDVAWYLAISAEAIGYSLEDILQMNVDKLQARYPDGFDKERSLHRAEGDI